MLKVSIIFLCVFITALMLTKVISEPSNSLSVKGKLRCGERPVENAKIHLYRNNTETLNDVIEHQISGPTGLFQINANTVNRPANETQIIPVLKIYHNCNDTVDESKKTQRRLQLTVPKDFVTLGHSPKKVYDIGVLNLELIYPGETRVKAIV